MIRPAAHQAHEAHEEYTVAGLTAPVEILIDTHGVPHLYAAGEDDLFLAQGFDAARDRLFQLDLWRRRGLGLLAEAFGERFVARDRAARLFLYRGDRATEWRSYGPGTDRVAAAFTAGVNAYVDLCERRPELLPPEFHALGHRPGRWQPEDVALIRSHGLFGNVEQEVARALTLREFGPRVEDLRRVREPARALRVPEGLDLSSVPDDVLAVYRLATAPVDFGAPGTPAPGIRPEGSNNWVIGPGRTATGRPLLANDPHRSITLPSLRRLVHLSAPGLDAIGAGEPALPGLSVGHNGHLAFGLTIFAIDQEDLYVYETHPDDPTLYRYEGGWAAMRLVHERIPVAGGTAPADVELHFTRHGPVIHRDPDRHRAFAVRAAWLEPGMAPYLGGLSLLRAHTTEEFLEALDRWGAPGENMVWATAGGTIGMRSAGRVPVRPGWDGLLPVPGDGRYEWDGTLPADALPPVIDPPEGWLASANEMNLPDGFPHDRRTIGFDWDHRHRYERIAEVLRVAEDITVEDCVRLQADTVNSAARRVLAIVADRFEGRGGEDKSTAHRSALALLSRWDGDERADSAAAALYQVWQRRHLRPALLRHALTPLVPAAALPGALARLLVDEELGADVRTDLALLAGLTGAAGSAGSGGSGDPAALDRILADSLTAAWSETASLLGDDPTRWRWGTLHHAAPAHPLIGLLSDRLRLPRLPRRERGGSGDTVLNTSYDDGFRQQEGASFRIVVDVGAWDRSRVVNTPGQSGRPDSPHWDDLYDTWADDGSFPLHYSRAAVEAHTRTRVILSPPGMPTSEKRVHP
ncbi:penicillin acylase family protein [Streptomyces erythrochromogenes]|uniref:penicillin acylase family protein n=1 Tax=Streptomyces erythrochromogenes TaxID=285574 RepID=UPI0034058DB6